MKNIFKTIRQYLTVSNLRTFVEKFDSTQKTIVFLLIINLIVSLSAAKDSASAKEGAWSASMYAENAQDLAASAESYAENANEHAENAEEYAEEYAEEASQNHCY